MIAKLIRVFKEKNIQSLAGNVITAGFGFLNFMILTRSFNKEIFGEWILFLTGATFIEMFRFGITSTALIRFLSGSDEENQKKLIGSNWMIGIATSIFIALLLWAILILFPEEVKQSGFYLFFRWYPILALLNLPFNNAISIQQAKQYFGQIFIVKTLSSGLFFIGLSLNLFWLKLDLIYVIWYYLGVAALVSIFTLLARWDGFRYIFHANKESNLTILNFGKYTTLTLIGSNLLRSADTFIIALSPLGTAAVALYSIPLKLTEVLQIPLRSFVATAFPKMSKASIENDLKMVRYYFYSYSGSITLLFIPVAAITFFFSDFFVLILGGRQYLGIDPITGASTSLIFKIFAIYGILLPIDRMTGVGLDSINKPKKNFYKIIYMVLANIIGDLIALFVFKSIAGVAVATVVFTIIGMIIGYYYLNKELQLKPQLIWIEGWKVYSKKIKEFLG